MAEAKVTTIARRTYFVNVLKRYGLLQLNMLEQYHHEGHLRHRSRRGEQLLVATAQPAETVKPRDGALDYPAALQGNEFRRSVIRFNTLHINRHDLLRNLNQFTSVAMVGFNCLDGRMSRGDATNQRISRF